MRWLLVIALVACSKPADKPKPVAIAKRPEDEARIAAARDLAKFLRSPDTQQFIASYGKGKYDGDPLFLPVTAK